MVTAQQAREKPVPCQRCGPVLVRGVPQPKTLTLNGNAVCDAHGDVIDLRKEAGW